MGNIENKKGVIMNRLRGLIGMFLIGLSFTGCSFSEEDKPEVVVKSENLLELIGETELRVYSGGDVRTLREEVFKEGEDYFSNGHYLTLDFNNLVSIELRLLDSIGVNANNLEAWIIARDGERKLPNPRLSPGPLNRDFISIDGLENVVKDYDKTEIAIVDPDSPSKKIVLYIKDLPRSTKLQKSNSESVFKHKGRGSKVMTKLNHQGETWSLLGIWEIQNSGDEGVKVVLGNQKELQTLFVKSKNWSTFATSPCSIDSKLSEPITEEEVRVRFVEMGREFLGNFDHSSDTEFPIFEVPAKQRTYVGIYVDYKIERLNTPTNLYILNAPAKCDIYCTNGELLGRAKSYRELVIGTSGVDISLDLSAFDLDIFYSGDDIHNSFSKPIQNFDGIKFTNSFKYTPVEKKQWKTPDWVGRVSLPGKDCHSSRNRMEKLYE